jgi:hypothetical protein
MRIKVKLNVRLASIWNDLGLKASGAQVSNQKMYLPGYIKLVPQLRILFRLSWMRTPYKLQTQASWKSRSICLPTMLTVRPYLEQKATVILSASDIALYLQSGLYAVTKLSTDVVAKSELMNRSGRGHQISKLQLQYFILIKGRSLLCFSSKNHSKFITSLNYSIAIKISITSPKPSRCTLLLLSFYHFSPLLLWQLPHTLKPAKALLRSEVQLQQR